ncbi:glycosyltransferase involved in cell wall biosynthesis [Pedobacter sp. W3I1]|uniref:glycosyltransferase family 4 protein n=1 Tax=Pedobacter sp. W3I1 TaxID=3042291 RepID=UPI00278A3770|nr:glycosyltransferase family 4 protein [Pedobacter sp. W3I1]MDQ0637104.1 glycosyltransferase involved in cell wall biosynthesis [Pedobacter sp. W3I1]
MLKDNSKLNIIIVNDFSNINGGAAKVAVDSAVGLSLAGYNVNYFCAVGNVDQSLLDSNVSISHLNNEEILYSKNKIKALFRGIWNVKAYRQMKKLLKTFNQENTIVHIHGWTKGLSISPIVCSLLHSYSTVITLHDYFIACPNGSFYNFQSKGICKKVPLSLSCIASNCDSRNYGFKLYRIIRSFVQKAMFVALKKKLSLISISKLSYEVLTPYIKGFKHTYYVENPVDSILIPRIEAELNKNCIFIGRLSSEKGVEYFCEAMLKLNIDDAIIIGEGDNFKNLIQKYPKFKFVGWKNKLEIRDILKSARFLVFPSVWYETYGLVVQEASSFGISSIVSDCTAACELINDGTDGMIFRSEDVNDLAEKISCMYNNDELLSSLSKATYEKFWNRDHSLMNHAKNLVSVYGQIVGKNELVLQNK